jgi:hypothetical protein
MDSRTCGGAGAEDVGFAGEGEVGKTKAAA